MSTKEIYKTSFFIKKTPFIMKNSYLLIGLLVCVFLGCSKENAITEVEEVLEETIMEEEIESRLCLPSEPNPDDLEHVNPLSIIQGKLLSWAVSQDEEIIYTPPGKWINLYGTVFYRYVERAQGSSIKIKEVAASATNFLTTEQLDRIIAIIPNQAKGEEMALVNRKMISQELINWRNDTPADESKILSLAKENGKTLSDLIIERTSILGQIQQELTAAQKDAMCELRKTADHANSNTDILTALDAQLNSEERTVLRLILNKFFVWSTGLESMNRLVDSGRPAVYFGFANLRVDDRAGENPSNGLRGEASKLIDGLLDDSQTTVLNKLVIDQTDLLETYFNDRGDLASLMTGYQTKNLTIDIEAIAQLAIRSEIVEAELAIIQAKAMGVVVQSMTVEQMKVLTDFKEGN